MKKRFRYNYETKEMEEVGHENAELRGIIIGDIEPFVSPVDGSVIGSRSTLREHMREHGLAHTADYNAPGGFWDRKTKERADYLAGKTNPASARRKSQMSDSFEHLRNQMRSKSRG